MIIASGGDPVLRSSRPGGRLPLVTGCLLGLKGAGSLHLPSGW